MKKTVTVRGREYWKTWREVARDERRAATRKPPARGDRVTLVYDRARRGTVDAAGPEQSAVRWDGAPRGAAAPAYPNRHLIRPVARVASRRR